MTTTTELTPLLKRLKLGAVLNTLPERVALARREQLDYASFLQIILTDEINRRDHRRLELRLQRAGFEQTCRLEDFDWSASVTLDRRLLDAAFSLQLLDRNEHVLLVGPVGVGKSFIAQALGYAAVRAGHTVRFVHADDFFRAMAQARVDHSTDKTFRSFLAPDLLILDDLGLHRMTQQQSIDLYELVIARHRTASLSNARNYVPVDREIARNYRPLRQVIDHPVRRIGDHCCILDVRSSNGVQGGVESGDSRSGAALAVRHQPARYINWYGAVARDSAQVHRGGRGGGSGPGRSCSE